VAWPWRLETKAKVMPIPKRLKLQPVGKDLLDEMSALCDAIERRLEFGETAEALLHQWHSHARRKCDPYEFQTYWKSVSKETFLQDALNPEPSFDKDVVYSEALALLDAVSTATAPDAEMGYYLRWLEAQFPGANMNDLIYWPDEWFGDASLFRDANGAFKPESEFSNDQILAYAMAKSGRKLPGAPANVALPFPIPGAK
jgi:hypothetical protein